MIYDELRNLVALARADNTVDIFDEAISLFETMGQDNYMKIFEATVSSSPGLTDEQVVLELLDDLHLIVNNIFTVQGISLIDEIVLSDKIKIAKAILSIFDYSDRVAIARILETDLNPEEKIAELISLVSDIPTEEAFTFITDVNPGVIARLSEVIKDNESETIEIDEDFKKVIQTYILFKQKILNDSHILTDKYLVEGGTIGLPYSVYLEDLLKHKAFSDLLIEMDDITKANDNSKTDEIAKHLLGIAILSIDSNGNYAKVIKDNLSSITSNVAHTTKIESSISEQLIRLTSAGAVNE